MYKALIIITNTSGGGRGMVEPVMKVEITDDSLKVLYDRVGRHLAVGRDELADESAVVDGSNSVLRKD